MTIARWTPPVAPTRQEQFLLKRLDRVRKLLGFLRLHRHELFDEACRDELATMYRSTGAGKAARPPALMAMAILVQGYLGMSDAEMIELTFVDLRVQMVLGGLGAEAPPFSQGALPEFRERLIAADLDRAEDSNSSWPNLPRSFGGCRPGRSSPSARVEILLRRGSPNTRRRSCVSPEGFRIGTSTPPIFTPQAMGRTCGEPGGRSSSVLIRASTPTTTGTAGAPICSSRWASRSLCQLSSSIFAPRLGQRRRRVSDRYANISRSTAPASWSCTAPRLFPVSSKAPLAKFAMNCEVAMGSSS